jgi:hypothetical protein
MIARSPRLLPSHIARRAAAAGIITRAIIGGIDAISVGRSPGTWPVIGVVSVADYGVVAESTYNEVLI